MIGKTALYDNFRNCNIYKNEIITLKNNDTYNELEMFNS